MQKKAIEVINLLFSTTLLNNKIYFIGLICEKKLYMGEIHKFNKQYEINKKEYKKRLKKRIYME